MPTCCCTWWTPPIPHHPEQMAEVQRVLHEIGADSVPQLLVFNKLDALDARRSGPCQAAATRSSWRACRCRASS